VCTVLALLRPGERWPLLIATNRDERLDRAFDPPGRWWPASPEIVAWRDRESGGSWLGVADCGVVATVVNHRDELGAAPGKRSRGELVLMALRAPTANAAAEALRGLDARQYRGFTLLVADRRAAFSCVANGKVLRVTALGPGHHMLTPEGVDRADAPRVAAHGDAFRSAPLPRPERDDWAGWIELLRREDAADPHQAMTVVTDRGFGTVASTLIGVPAAGEPVMRYADGPPTRAAFRPAALHGFVA
jgi:uncharacterized protein with NRDE domain